MRRLAGALLVSALPNAVVAQDSGTLEGVVLEEGSGAPIAYASVQLSGAGAMGQGPRLTSPAGEFRFEALAPGGYTVRVSAAGYAEREITVQLEDAASLLVVLQPAPFQFDTLAVDLRTLEIRGLVRDRASGARLARTEIVTNLGRVTDTDLLGQFRIPGVPATEPLVIGVRAFGYLPVDSLVRSGEGGEPAPTEEIVFDVEPDPIVERMIGIEVERLEERARPRRSALMRTLDREELLERGQRRTALDLVTLMYPPRQLGRIRCVVIDERQAREGLDALAAIMPDQLERIEVLSMPGFMLRVYTREFIRRRLGTGQEPRPILYIPLGTSPICR